MKNLKEITEQLEIEIKNKKRDLTILKTDQIMRNLTIDDLADFYNTTQVGSDRIYLNVYPRTPLRSGSSKLMTKSIGNIDILDDEKILVRKRYAVIYFKKRWEEERKNYELLKEIS